MREGFCYRVTVKGERTAAFVIEAMDRDEAAAKARHIRGGEITRVHELHASQIHAPQFVRRAA